LLNDNIQSVLERYAEVQIYKEIPPCVQKFNFFWFLSHYCS